MIIVGAQLTYETTPIGKCSYKSKLGILFEDFTEINRSTLSAFLIQGVFNLLNGFE